MRAIPKDQKYRSNILPWFTIGIFSINLLILALLIFNASMLRQVKNQLPLVLGQLLDGRAITLSPQAYYQRHSETIRKFVGETLTLIFTNSKKTPSSSALNLASDLFAPQLKEQLSLQIQDNNRNQNPTSIFIIENISHPQVIQPGVWQLTVNARRIIFPNQDMTGESINWQKKLIIKATDTSQTQFPQPEKSLHQAINKLQKRQLQITNICDLEHHNCTSQ